MWDVETGKCKDDVKLVNVGRSIGLSYSGNLAVCTTAQMAQPSLAILDLREKDLVVSCCLVVPILGQVVLGYAL